MTDRERVIIWAKETLNSNNVVFLDTETTGFSSSDRIVDLGVINTKGKSLIDILINPEMKMPKKASEVNKITDDMLTWCPKFSELYMTIKQILNGKTIIAWNSSFDERMVRQEFERLNIEPPKCTWIDAMQMYGSYANKGKYYKLCLAVQDCGIVEEQEHRAVSDCILTLKVLEVISNNK